MSESDHGGGDSALCLHADHVHVHHKTLPVEVGRHSGRPRHEPVRLQGPFCPRLRRAAVLVRGVGVRRHGPDAFSQAESVSLAREH